MNTVTTQQYAGYSPYIINNKQDNQVQKVQTPEAVKNITLPEIKENRQLSNQEVAALHFNRQATQLTKDLINIYAGVESSKNEVTLKDINEFQRKSNRNELIQNYSGENIDKSKLIQTLPSVERQITNQEAAAIYFKHQENELTKNKIDIYLNVEAENDSTNEISYKNINDIHKQNNRNEFLQNFNPNDEKIYA